MVENILILNSTGQIGGASIALLDILDEFNFKGYSPIVWLPSNGLLETQLKNRKIKYLVTKSSLLHSYEHINIKFDLNSFKRVLKAILFFIPSFVKLYRLDKEYKFKFIYFNSSIFSPIVLIALVLRIKVIIQIREMPYLNYLGIIVFKLQAYIASKLLCCSKSIIKKLEDIHIHNCVLTYDWVDLKKFQPTTDLVGRRKALKIESLKYLVGMANGLTIEKGLYVFLDAIKIFKKQNNSTNVKFYLIGDFHCERSKDLFYRYVKIHKIEKLVALTGWVNDVSDYISAMDLMVSPNIKEEGFGKTIIEAQASGKCVIASNVDPVNELIEDKKTGLLFSRNDSQELANLILKCFKNPESCLKIGENSYKFATTFHDKNILVSNLLSHLM